MLKCCKCGKILDENELSSYEDDRGEFWGTPCSETISCCPYCGGDEFEEVHECPECGRYHEYSGTCDDCLLETAGDIDLWMNISKNMGTTESVKINSMLAYYFTEEEIEEILLKELKQHDDCKEYIKDDTNWAREAYDSYQNKQ